MPSATFPLKHVTKTIHTNYRTYASVVAGERLVNSRNIMITSPTRKLRGIEVSHLLATFGLDVVVWNAN